MYSIYLCLNILYSRLVHPIEKNMDDAIKNVRNEGLEVKDECMKTRKSYFKQKYVGHRNARY